MTAGCDAYFLLAFPAVMRAFKRGLIALVLLGLGQLVQAAEERFAFSVNDLDASLASYRIDAETGQLHFLRYYPLAKSTPSVVIDPSGQFVLATSQAIDRVFVFRFNRQTGDLQEVPGSPFDVGGRAPFQIEFHPSGRFLYMAHRFAGVGAYAFDTRSGTVTPLAGSPFPAGQRVRSIVLTPSARHLYAMNAYDNTFSGFRVDVQTGRLTPLAGFPLVVSDVGNIDYLAQDMQDVPATAGGLPYHMTSDPAGRFLFVTNAAAANISVFRIDDDSGTVSEVEGSPFFTGFNPYSATVDPSGQRLYVVLSREHKIAVHRIDAKTGRLTLEQGSPYASGGRVPARIVFTRDGERAYINNMASNDIAEMAVDADTGVLSVLSVLKTRSAPWDFTLADGEPAPASVSRLFASQQLGEKGALAIFTDGLKPLASAPNSGLPVASVRRAGGDYAYTVNADKGSVTAFHVAPDLTATDQPGLQFIGDADVGKQPSAIATDVNGWYLYVTNRDDDTLSVLYIDPDTGLPKQVRGSPVSTGKRPVSVTLDPASRYAFVVNQGSNNISVYRYRSNVSPLIFESVFYNSPYAAGKEPVDLAVDPGGRYAYVANAGDNTISAYRIHHETGALSALPGSPFTAGHRPLALAVHPGGQFLLAVNRDSRDVTLFRIETALGAIVPLGKPLKLPLTPKGLWLSASGDEGYVLSVNGKHVMTFSLNASTGEMALLGNKKMSSEITDLTPFSSKE